ncbi:MAG: peptidoglycan bridge formation glycyltransferase FemA/FemB family protein [bacterium]|nr:peptidoglycan bridge formation glycyltransferase FemA/FemB family protein [bacterium]
MKIINNLTEKQYKDFFNKSKYNHFLQCYAWGKASIGKGLKPVYLGLVDEQNKIHAVCLAFEKEKFNLKYYYAPRGPIIDFENKELLKEFSIALKKYLKENNGIYFKIDPGIILHILDENANPIKDEINNEWLHDYLIDLGFKFKGYTKLFEANQPRFTFRIDTKREIEEIEKSMNKTYLKTIKRSYNYDLEINDYFDADIFYKLMKDIANKDNFNGFPKEFYDNFNKEFTKDKNVKYVTIKIYPDKILKKTEDELKNIEEKLNNGLIPDKKKIDTENIIKRLQKDIEVFSPYKNKYPEGLISLILICPIINNKMWTLYIGNNSLATYTFAVNRAYYEAIKIAHNNNCDFIDLFGTSGDPNTNVKNYAGIHEYKRKMGGTYIEFIGEYDLVEKPIINKILPLFIKIYRKFKKM